jgi:hypothetical protein
MAKRREGTIRYVAREIREEAEHQLRRGFPREFKRQLSGFGDEAKHQLTSGWGREFARQIFGTSRHRHRSR